MKHIVWFITSVCNYRCPYCDVRSNGMVGEVDASWVERYNPTTLDISGGEPFLVPNMVEILEQVPCKVAITTNLSRDMTQFVQRVPPSKIAVITCSYHPSHTQLDPFIGKLLMLRHRGFHVQVNIVAYPEQMWLIPDLMEMFRQLKVGVHVDPYRQHDGRPYSYTTEEEQLIATITPGDRNHLLSATVPRVVECTAGIDHMVVDDQGMVYRCLADKLYGINMAIGYVYDGMWLGEPTICDHGNACCGCDADHCTRTDI